MISSREKCHLLKKGNDFECILFQMQNNLVGFFLHVGIWVAIVLFSFHNVIVFDVVVKAAALLNSITRKHNFDQLKRQSGVFRHFWAIS